MSDLATQLQALLKARGLEEPDGRPLYAYRCDRAELQSLKDQLTAVLSAEPHSLGPKTKQAFCLFAAEYFRRSYRGGVWSWNEVLESIGALYLASGESGYPVLCDMVIRGVREWKRDLLQNPHGRLFLVTLVCEGGLPLYLVKQEQARLRTFFRALFEEVRIHQHARASVATSVQDLAKRVGYALPASLRQDVVFELSGQLIAKVWDLLATVREASDPIATLDRDKPGWRSELPLDLEDEVARAFLNGLVKEARGIRHGTQSSIAWKRFLTVRNDTESDAPGEGLSEAFELSAELDIPALLGGGQFVGMFGDEAPSRFELCLIDERGAVEPVALGAKHSDGSTLRLEALARALRPVSGSSAVERRSLVVRSGQGRLGPSLQFSGALALSPLPWTFVPDELPSGAMRYQLFGEGSQRVRHPQAMVAVPHGFLMEAKDDAQCDAVGTIRHIEPTRTVLRVTGTVTLKSPSGDLFTVRTHDPAAVDPTDYRLSGRLFEIGHGVTSVFRGMPRLMSVSRSGVTTRVAEREVQWCAARPGAKWGMAVERCFGSGILRHVCDGTVQFTTRLMVLPATFAVSFHPVNASEGVIELSGIEGADVGIAPVAGVVATTERTAPGKIALRLVAELTVPVEIRLQLLWQASGALELTVPFPANVTAFIAPGGRRVWSGASVSVSQLAGLQALALVPTRGREFRVDGTFLSSRHGEPSHRRTMISQLMPEAPPGMHTLDLGAVQQSVVRLLNSSDDLDCAVRLSVVSNDTSNVTTQSIVAKRYDLDFEWSEDGSAVRIPGQFLLERALDEIAALRVEAVSLLQPAADPVRLDRAGSAAWSVANEALTPGPWLLLGWEGQWCRVRPRLHVASDGTGTTVESETRVGLSQSCQLADPEDRRESIRASLLQMALDPDHADWALIKGYVRLCDALPPSTFDAMRVLADTPEAVAMAALVLQEGDAPAFDILWNAVQSLPFCWLSLTRDTWTKASERWLTPRRRTLELVKSEGLDPVGMVNAHYFEPMVRRLCDPIRLPWLRPVFEHAREIALELEPGRESKSVRTSPFAEFAINAYWEGISRIPSAPLNGPDPLPRTHELFMRSEILKATAVKRLFVDRTKQRGLVSESREAFLNAPAIAALCAVDDVDLEARERVELRNAWEHDPSWFGEAYKWAYLYALALRTHKREPRRIRVNPR